MDNSITLNKHIIPKHLLQYFKLKERKTIVQQGFISHLITIFAECKRVLKDTGTMWVNLGDSYIGSGGWTEMKEGWVPNKQTKHFSTNIEYSKTRKENSIKKKSLCNIPSRFRIAMTDELGLIQRNNIIWYKPNAMPSSATDRFTVDFEDIMFFVKQGKYYFEQQLEKSIWADQDKRSLVKGGVKSNGLSASNNYATNKVAYTEGGNKNLRTVWEVNTVPSPDKHYAMYPEKLLVRMIEAGCPKEICNKCGKARMKIYDRKLIKNSWGKSKKTDYWNNDGRCGDSELTFKGLSDCGCNAGFTAGIVLDPFSGAGTTGITARKLGRNYINIELHPNNVKITEDRIERKLGTLFN